MITTETLGRYGGLACMEYTYPKFRRGLMMASQNGPVAAVRGSVDGKPAGLVLASVNSDKGAATIQSLYVAPDFRRRGLGRRLMEHIERDLRARSVQRVSLGYLDSAETAALPRVLAGLSWDAPELERILCYADRRIFNARWMSKPPQLPRGYEIFPWSELRPDERAALLTSQADNPWIHSMADPFKGDGTFAFNSVGLRHRGAVVGWLVTDQFDNESLMYSCSYIRPDLQGAGFIIPLYVEAIRRHAERGQEFPKALWVVPCVFPKMVRFVRRWIAPFATSIEEYKFSNKSLAPSAAA
jgi:GNAT superfamily N-acetyltransferase